MGTHTILVSAQPLHLADSCTYHNLAKTGKAGACVSRVPCRPGPPLSPHAPFSLILLKGLFLSFNKDLEAAEAETEGWSRSNRMVSGAPWDPQRPLVQKEARWDQTLGPAKRDMNEAGMCLLVFVFRNEGD